jgi:hypothetical protein
MGYRSTYFSKLFLQKYKQYNGSATSWRRKSKIFPSTTSARLVINHMNIRDIITGTKGSSLMIWAFSTVGLDLPVILNRLISTCSRSGPKVPRGSYSGNQTGLFWLIGSKPTNTRELEAIRYKPNEQATKPDIDPEKMFSRRDSSLERRRATRAMRWGSGQRRRATQAMQRVHEPMRPISRAGRCSWSSSAGAAFSSWCGSEIRTVVNESHEHAFNLVSIQSKFSVPAAK